MLVHLFYILPVLCSLSLCLFLFPVNLACSIVVTVGRGGALVESTPFDWRVAGSNPALAATIGVDFEGAARARALNN